MKPSVIQGIVARLDRADENCRAIESKFRGGVDSEIEGVLHIEQNRDRTRLDVYLDIPNEEWGPVVSDTLHQLRSALDNLAYALSEAHSGQLGPEDSRRIGFPIYTDRDSYLKRRTHNVDWIAPGAVEVIERAQPYHRSDGPIPWHPLAMLSELNNRDKHRAPHIAVFDFESLSYQLPPEHPAVATEVIRHPRPNNGARLLRISFAEPFPKGMEVGFGMRALVGLDYVWAERIDGKLVDRSVPTPINSTLAAIRREARGLVDQLTPFLDHGLPGGPALPGE